MSILVVFGRGIERPSHSSHDETLWQPTAYLERLTPEGKHSGVRSYDLTLDSKDSVIAGAHANVMAAVNCCNTAYFKPEFVIFAAGRPDYLKNAPANISEGSVLAKVFQAKTRSKAQIIIQDQNKNTWDDLVKSLEFAHQTKNGFVKIISVLVHIARISQFLKHVKETRPDLKNINVDIIASELELLEKGTLKEVLGYQGEYQESILLHKHISVITMSPAYQRTAGMEQRGINALREGKYNFLHQGYQFAK